MSTQDEIQKAVGMAMEGYFQGEKAQKVERYKRLNKMVKPGQIVFAGSSLMEQFPISEMLMNLDEQLPLSIYNRGIGGYVTQEMAKVLDVVIYDLKPKYLFLNIGTNDLSSPDYKEEELIARYRAILEDIRAHLPEAKIYLMAYYPLCPEVGMKNPWLKAVMEHRNNARTEAANAAVKKMAEEMGIEYFDFNKNLKDEKGDLKAEYTIEGMHMYANGYEQVLNEMLPLLRSLC